MEVLACQIRNSAKIQGFLLPGANGKQFRVRQYADDTTCFVKNLFSLKHLFELISIYEKGLVPNSTLLLKQFKAWVKREIRLTN